MGSLWITIGIKKPSKPQKRLNQKLIKLEPKNLKVNINIISGYLRK